MPFIPVVVAVVLGAARVSSPADVAKEPRCVVTAAVEKDELVARCGKDVLFRTALAKKVVVPQSKRLEPQSGGEESIEDDFTVAGDLVIVRRGVHVLGAFCHTPRIERVDVFTRDGRFRSYVKEDTELFSGRILVSPDREWIVLLLSGEARLYGYGVLDANGAIVDGQTRLRLTREIWDEGGEFKGDTFVMGGFTIHRDGEYEISAD